MKSTSNHLFSGKKSGFFSKLAAFILSAAMVLTILPISGSVAKAEGNSDLSSFLTEVTLKGNDLTGGDSSEWKTIHRGTVYSLDATFKETPNDDSKQFVNDASDMKYTLPNDVYFTKTGSLPDFTINGTDGEGDFTVSGNHLKVTDDGKTFTINLNKDDPYFS